MERLSVVILRPEDVETAERTLRTLVEETDALGAYLLIGSGEVAARHIDDRSVDLPAAGALLVGAFRAAGEIARMLGDERLTTTFLQGTRRHVACHAVGDDWLLAVVFAPISGLGLVRVTAARAAESLAPIATASRSRAVESGELPRSLGEGVVRAIDRLFEDRR
ncbi:MAG: hypothetical protein EPO26_08580 [Chloroflexota bacterium]|nr:MAG: hypothetical protein EPO26_08580 [Chloroflexota bacterium]